MFQNGIRQFRKQLRSVVKRYEPGDADAELADLHRVLRQAGRAQRLAHAGESAAAAPAAAAPVAAAPVAESPSAAALFAESPAAAAPSVGAPPRDLERTGPQELASLVALEEQTAWLPQDCAGVLRRLLDTELGALVPGAPGAAQNLTVGGLFVAREPDRAALVALKDFAKRAKRSPAPAFPVEVASALYHACTRLARQRGLRGVSSLSDEAYRQGEAWCAQQHWLDDDLRARLGLAPPAPARLARQRPRRGGPRQG
jgi:hypothetical protein